MASLGRFVWMTIPEKILLYGFVRMYYTWAPMLSDSWGISRDQMTLILTAGELSSIAGGFVTPFADNFGNRLIANLSWILATICAGLALIQPTFTSILIIRLVFCFMAIVYIVCAQSTVITSLEGKEQNGMATGLSETSWSLSSLALIPLLSILYDHFGWFPAFAVFAGLMALFILEVFFYFPEDKRLRRTASNEDIHENSDRNLSFIDRIRRSNYMTVITNMTAMTFNFSSLFFNISHNTVFVCFTYWAVDRYNVDVEQMALVGFLLGAAELIGSFAVMFLADRLGIYNCIYVSLCLFICILVGFGFAADGSFDGGVALFCILYIPAEFVIVAQIAAAEMYVGSSLRSTMLGINFQSHFAGRAVGAAISTVLWNRGGLFWMTVVGCICAILSFICVFFAHRWIRMIINVPRESRVSSVQISAMS